MKKISYEHYLAMLQNIDMEDEDILEYSIVEPNKGFEVELKPNPDLVMMTQEQQDRESAMKIGNGIARMRRQSAFNRRMKNNDNRPVLVSEGDSWFQFPFLVDDIIDHLGNDYSIWSVDAAGDTAKNMVFGPEGNGKREYLKALNRQKDCVQGFLFSAAGNDIIGEDPDTGERALQNLLREYNGNDADVTGHINQGLLNSRLEYLRTAYQTVIVNVREECPSLPIFIHGYDYVFPYPEGSNDPRAPIHTKKKTWIAPPLDNRGIMNQTLRRDIIKNMIDQLYSMLEGVAGDSDQTKVYVVNCRGAMPNVGDWIDEIHGTSHGFVAVADRFAAVIRHAGIQ
jgi:N-acetylmuramoyl-L-alanine amidase